MKQYYDCECLLLSKNDKFDNKINRIFEDIFSDSDRRPNKKKFVRKNKLNKYSL